MTINTVTLTAPVSGVIVPLEQVPDPVFSGKIVGDGVSIDPTSSELLAPCDGLVLHLHQSHHALTLETADGIEVMVHIGLDTVDLKGAGFTPCVEQGAQVRRGDLLIRFDADYVATRAKSLLTQVVITNTQRVSRFRPSNGLVRANRDACLVLELAPLESARAQTKGTTVTSDALRVPNHSGLHARPAAVLASLAKSFESDIRLNKGDDQGNAKSVVGIMALDVAMGDEVCVVAVGSDANEAVEQIAAAIASGLGEESGDKIIEAAEPITAPPPVPRSKDENLLIGVGAAPGLAVGTVVQVRHRTLEVPENAQGSARDERHKLDEAIERARQQISGLQGRMQQEKSSSEADIFAAHRELLGDPQLLDLAQSGIEQGKSAAFAWQQSFTDSADRLAQLDNELLAARATDLRDVGGRVLRLLLGSDAGEAAAYPANAILIAQDLTPSDTASLDTSRVLGFATVAGGASSHVAILANALGIPAVAGIEPRALTIEDGDTVVLDGRRGELRLNPSDDQINDIRGQQAQAAERLEQAKSQSHLPATTLDGQRIEVAANIGSVEDAREGIANGADGVGLLRTEFLFLKRAKAPDEEEQTSVYSDIAAIMEQQQAVIVRTLDVGGDKPLPYLPLAHEDNPFLGERGIRVGLNRPTLLRTQLRAILRASQRGRVRIMFPMISSLDEIREVKTWLEQERRQLDVAAIEIGIMVEVPAAALMARQFSAHVDFFSIGTNDLTQYTLAMDRGHPRLAPLCDGLHPAVLRLIDLTVKGGQEHSTWVGVCGGIASDAAAVPILLGLGITELSVSVPAIATIKAQVRRLDMSRCRELAASALAADTAAQVRTLVSEFE